MTIDRRSLIKGMALCGIAAPILAALPALAQADDVARAADRSTQVLVGAGAADSSFVRGARAGVQAPALHVREASLEIGFLLGFEQELRGGPSTRVIGLLDDAVATPLLDLARSAGARVSWLGLHVVGPGATRHRLLTTPLTEDVALQFGRQLEAAGAGFSLDEDRAHRAGATRRLAAGTRADGDPEQWAAAIGYLLASSAARGPVDAPPLRAGGAPLRGSFVSFSIES